MTFDVLSFILGWAGCCTLIFIAEWLTDIRQSRADLSDYERQLEGDLPWHIRER